MASRPGMTACPTRSRDKLVMRKIAKYTNDIATYAREIRGIREMVEECEDEEMRKIHLDTVEQLTRKMERIQERVFKKRALISPIRSLPVELLALIFDIHVNEHHHNPLVVLAICRHWRYVARGIPSLWTRIYVRFRRHVFWRAPALPWYGSNNAPLGLVARCTDEIKQLVQLSRNSPLDVNLDFYINSDNVAAFDLICSCSHRWRSLQWGVENDEQSWRLSEHWAQKDIAFPLLEQALIGPWSPQEDIDVLLTVIENTAASMTTLVAFVPLSPLLSRHRKLLQRIKHLRWYGSTKPPTDNLLSTNLSWEFFEQVQTLYLSDTPSEYFTNDVPHRPSKLTTLRLDKSVFRGLLNCGPSLTSLKYVHFEGLEVMFTDVPHAKSIQLPAVTHFTLVYGSYRPLSWFSLPSLVSLELYGGLGTHTGAKKNMDAIWKNNWIDKAAFPSETLHIQHVGDHNLIVNILKYLPHIQHLHLYHHIPSKTYRRLFHLLAKGPTTSMRLRKGGHAAAEWRAKLCPDLRSLTVVCTSLNWAKKEDCRLTLEEIKKARMGTKSEIQSVKSISSSKRGQGSENEAGKLVMKLV